jgi:hypothetical protein
VATNVSDEDTVIGPAYCAELVVGNDPFVV